MIFLIPVAIGLVGVGLKAAYIWFMNVVLERLIALGLLSWLGGWILGERARKVIGDLWLSVFNLIIGAVATLGRLVGRLFR